MSLTLIHFTLDITFFGMQTWGRVIMKTTHHLLISMAALMLWGCPEDPTEEPGGGEMAGETAGMEVDFDPFTEAGSTTDMT